ncbi:hypothetical protein PRZ48_014655 [Zasmidium cellare]|uniref:ATPase synthesis protein 25 n=1 Tax=Zasmidium cellare TaxID=395010 RepID=A0ABR0DYY8_ZASCE|nr:hypothetical protein PRZ48_014655 [Zasmidium cellare]
MALPTAAARNLACHSCRQWMLRSFISSIGGSVVQPSSRRAFSAPSIRLNEARERVQKEEREEQGAIDTDGKYAPLEDGQESAQDGQEQTTHVPWYLQVESPIPEQENVVSARQKIPDLPEHPPPILQPLLERISVELGMDDLSLLDLRGLDPPPALGANLLMIVGTARSEKHLHFSADKLCRWLRSEHHLTPYADGLLGRQELKLKMRRRAKRSRLLSAVGAKATADSELDEGIRTGWICVNLGRVEGGDLPKSEKQLAQEANVVGFGTQTSGARIVVQLLTEEKRGEIDLEKLWTAVMKKSTREEALREKEEDEGTEEEQPEQQSTPAPQPDAFGLPQRPAFAQQQARAFHTSSRRALAVPTVPLDTTTKQDLPAAFESSDGAVESADSRSTLKSLLESLARMPHDAALATLGDDFMTPAESEDTQMGQTATVNGTSDFVISFNAALPPFPDPVNWHAHVQLLALAYRFGHPNVYNDTLLAALQNVIEAGQVPMERTYTTVLGALLGKVERNSPTFERDMEPIFDLLEEMEHYGYNALRPEILEVLHRVLVGPPTATQPTTLQSLVPALGLARLKRHLASGDMKKFWQTWNSFPRRLMPRPVEQYVVLYDALASEKTGMDFHQTRDNLSYWIYEMEHEKDPVTVENGGVELAMSLFKAIKYVDPLAEIKEWNDVRGKCEKVLRAALQ